MNNAPRVRKRNRVADILENLQPAPERVLPAISGIIGRNAGQDIVEVLASQQLHRKIGVVGGIQPDFVHWNDIGMFQGGGDARFPKKSELVTGAGGVLPQFCQCHVAVGVVIVGAVNGLHSTLADRTVNRVFIAGCRAEQFRRRRSIIGGRDFEILLRLAVRVVLRKPGCFLAVGVTPSDVLICRHRDRLPSDLPVLNIKMGRRLARSIRRIICKKTGGCGIVSMLKPVNIQSGRNCG